ncbi:hypothetical protein [Paenibacillus periandrae]|uniref:hypothetical protein n=1 Tax=Paenibacillus periandrae TaxID=1761741 RepID=UPI001F095DD5|nr:hypothetical protein [Paenibacillus periandrae]
MKQNEPSETDLYQGKDGLKKAREQYRNAVQELDWNVQELRRLTSDQDEASVYLLRVMVQQVKNLTQL